MSFDDAVTAQVSLTPPKMLAFVAVSALLAFAYAKPPDRGSNVR